MTQAIEALKLASVAGEAGQAMIEVARILSNGGWPIFPCALDKRPLTKEGFKARTKDHDQIERWWATHPDAMPAIVPGDCGLAALDVDTAQAMHAFNAMFPNEGNGHFVVQTGGTSQPYLYNGVEFAPAHVYVLSEGPLKAEGLVVRYDTGYVIAPGARRGDRVYRVSAAYGPKSVGLMAPPEKPKRVPADPAPDLERARAALKFIPNDCDRNEWVAMAHMIHGALGDDGREDFLEWSRQWDGPTNEGENERVWESLPKSSLGWEALWKTAAKYGFNADKERDDVLDSEFGPLVGAGTPPAGDPVPSQAEVTREKLLEMVRRISDAPDDFERAIAYYAIRKLGFTLHEVMMMLQGLMSRERSDGGASLAELLQKPELLENPAPAIPMLAWPGMKTVLAAREKTGKTTLALAGVAAVTRGDVFLGEQTTPQKVLWLTEESPKVLVQRAQEMRVDPEKLFIVSMGQNPPAQLKAAVELHKPQLVVIDTLYRFAMIENENEAGSWIPVVILLDEITKDGVSVLLLAHSKKGETSEYRGSTAIGGYVDAILEMRRPKSGDRVRRIDGRGRLSFGKPFSVRLVGNTDFELVTEAQEVVAEEVGLEALILKHLKLHGTHTSGTAISRSLTKQKDSVLKALKKLEADGFVVKETKGWRAKQAEDEFSSQEVEHATV